MEVLSLFDNSKEAISLSEEGCIQNEAVAIEPLIKSNL